MLKNLKKYKVQSSVGLLLGVSPVIVTGLLYALGIILFPLPVIMSGIAALATIFLGLALIASIPKIEKRRIKVEKEFFEKWEQVCKGGDPFYGLKKLIETRLPSPYGLLAPSDKQIKNFLEKKSEDVSGNTYLHKVILLEDTKRAANILGSIHNYFTNMFDSGRLDWNIQNNKGQTLLHIAAERNEPVLATLFLRGDKKNFKFNLSLQDIKNRTAMMITDQKASVGKEVHKDFYKLYEKYESLYSDLLSKRCFYDSGYKERQKEKIIKKANQENKKEVEGFKSGILRVSEGQGRDFV